jgi:hypothetical protein
MQAFVNQPTPSSQKKGMLLCDLYCTQEAVGESADSFITEKDMLLCDFHHEAFGEPADSFITKKRQKLLQELSDQRHDVERVPSLRHHQRSSTTDEVQNKTENQPIALLQVELVSSKMVSENQKNFTATCEPTNPSRWFITSGMLAQDWSTN